jgi:hypothetical protein
MKPKRFKAWDMGCHWIKDRFKRKQLRPCWDKGIHNWADCFAKHFPPACHKIMRCKHLQKVNNRNSNIIQAGLSASSHQTVCEGALLAGDLEVQSRSDVVHKTAAKLTAH